MIKPLQYIVDPFKVIKNDKLEFFIWFVFTIFAGQLGILANIIIRYFSHSIPVSQSIYLDSAAGSFYTYAIAIAASALGPLFANFIKNKRPEFTSLKIVSIILVIFFLVLSGVIYAAVQIKSLTSEPLSLDLVLDVPQFTIYVLAIFIGLYTYCLLKISSPDYSHLDDSFNEQDDATVKEVVSDSKKLKDDGTGVKL
ncbi:MULTISPECIES: hypothetical protein [Vibrio harveyi group]|uniref:hypothetical protein n=1 Tax=Vibrio harveyi group TaxID=717610 RepID=UPI001DA159B3|nr:MULTISPECIES: hypothetical protein [Vibrio harveyi group]EGQ8739896.1 hypothetical protein [Vibrio parahaemolyticus]EGQ8905080.1 hypothetical protein [Vibrio parahaemolyticus]EJG0274803.1 hypothetical protein [Vibrio parahaemolyticus]EJG1196764.1 hypothetical protein [Vibrio parahaemolyticus]MCR9306468.1 hypothetical protein [Vibrio diabolicus]